MVARKTKFEYTIIDKATVQYYLLFGNKTEAYMWARNKGNEVNHIFGSSASRYFGTDKIKALLSLVSEELKRKLPDMHARLGVKNSEISNNTLNDINDTLEYEDISKDDAIVILTNAIRANPKDKAVLKELMPRLSELKDWKREQVSSKSNVLMYELPTKKLSR